MKNFVDGIIDMSKTAIILLKILLFAVINNTIYHHNFLMNFKIELQVITITRIGTVWTPPGDIRGLSVFPPTLRGVLRIPVPPARRHRLSRRPHQTRNQSLPR